MGRSRDDEWSTDFQVYEPGQVKAIIESIGIRVNGQTKGDWTCYCPYHGNVDTTAFSVSKKTGRFICFNPACGEAGSLERLLREVGHLDEFQIYRLTHGGVVTYEPVEIEKYEFKEWEFADNIPIMKSNFKGSPAEDYMHGRHFDDDTLDKFDVGYAQKHNRVVVPMHDPTGIPVGVIGRSIDQKAFKNSVGLPTSHTLFNLHRARGHETVIVVEASFSAMRVTQAGYPNVVATISGHLSQDNINWLDRYFSTIIIMTDSDKKIIYAACRKCARAGYSSCQGHLAGLSLGQAIVEQLPHKRMMWAAYSESERFPRAGLAGYRNGPAKDPDDLSDEEIRRMVRGSVSDFEASTFLLHQEAKDAILEYRGSTSEQL